jgi:hypothetical protein
MGTFVGVVKSLESPNRLGARFVPLLVDLRLALVVPVPVPVRVGVGVGVGVGVEVPDMGVSVNTEPDDGVWSISAPYPDP